MKKKLVKESYELSMDVQNRLNTILANEWLAFETYSMAVAAMKGDKQHEIEEVGNENAFDEKDDHFNHLLEWMQSKGYKVVTNRSEMEGLANCTKFNIVDGTPTSKVLDALILSENEAIDDYEDVLDMPEIKYDLKVMLAGFLKDEREHLKKLTDIRDGMI